MTTDSFVLHYQSSLNDMNRNQLSDNFWFSFIKPLMILQLKKSKLNSQNLSQKYNCDL